MVDSRINLKNRWLAAGLALLIPGAGQLYQGRLFKGVIYLVCISGTFLCGMWLGNWRPVYWTEPPGGDQFYRGGKRNYGYLAQVGMGAPALFALLQTNRYRSPDNAPFIQQRRGMHEMGDFDGPFTKPFSGVVVDESDDRRPLLGTLHGEVALEKFGETVVGEFRGQWTPYLEGRPQEPQTVTWPIGKSIYLDSRILGDPHRILQVARLDETETTTGEILDGHVPRRFIDWFEAPLDQRSLQELNREIPRRFELALVYTWIAGLLNILAVWDALDGPAYGYGDEQPETGDEKKKETTQPAPEPATTAESR